MTYQFPAVNRAALGRLFDEWLASGRPWVWLTAGAVSVSLIMVCGLLLLITLRGMGHFWPSDVVRYRLHGGAGVIPRDTPPAEREVYLQGLQAALREGRDRLARLASSRAIGAALRSTAGRAVARASRSPRPLSGARR